MGIKQLTFQDHIRVIPFAIEFWTNEGNEKPSLDEFAKIMGDSFDVDENGHVTAKTTEIADFVKRLRVSMVERWGEQYVSEFFERLMK